MYTLHIHIHIYIYIYIYLCALRKREGELLLSDPSVPEVLGCVLFGWLKSSMSIFVGQSTDLLSCNHGFKQCWEEFDAFC